MRNRHELIVLPGDGIGPEVVREAGAEPVLLMPVVDRGGTVPAMRSQGDVDVVPRPDPATPAGIARNGHSAGGEVHLIVR